MIVTRLIIPGQSLMKSISLILPPGMNMRFLADHRREQPEAAHSEGGALSWRVAFRSSQGRSVAMPVDLSRSERRPSLKRRSFAARDALSRSEGERRPSARKRLCRLRYAHLSLAAFTALATASFAAAPREIDFNRDVRPILAENCFACHGRDAAQRKADLRLDVRDAAIEAGAIAPRDGEGSTLVERIRSAVAAERMPPPKSKKVLTEEQKAILTQWIAEGAKYQAHWAFLEPVRPAPPELARSGQAPGAIDRFVRARLEAEGLAPSPEADRGTLIRRLTLDLLGLPPSAEEVEAFVADRDPKAYEHLVKRLLESPHFGERLALDWLDSARYADTNGFSIDGGRHAWLWRDWVIQAFNDNKPYDQFLLEQLAGDLLPDRTEGQLIATGFQRNNMVTHEGGTIPEENLTNYNADRVKTLGESILGLTLGCAQCHDHKFDPVAQQEYYQLFAFFNTLDDRGLDGNAGVNPGPSVTAHTVLRTSEVASLRARIAALAAELARPDPAVLEAWVERQRALDDARGQGLALHPLEVLKVSTPNRGAGFDMEDGNRVRLRQVGDLAAFDISTRLPELDAPITGLRVVVHPLAELPGGGWGSGPVEPRRARRARSDKDKEGDDREDDPAFKGTFMLTAIAVTADAVPGDQVNLHRLQAIERVTASSWDPSHPPAGCLDPRNEDGWAPDLAASGPVHLTATFAAPIRTELTPFLTAQLNFGAGKSLVPGLIEVFAVTGNDDDTDLPPAIVAALETAERDRPAEVQAELWRYCADHAEEPRSRRVALANLKERLAVLTEAFPAMVMNVAAKPRATFILNRGDYSQPTTQVSPGTPAALPPLPEGAPANRLGLAQWLTMRDNPLTARVAANRLWKLFFGTGIVATPADFGAQGEWPSHPELLDWLAVEFVESGWNVKHLVRLIVTSATYRQRSSASPEFLARDPANRLLARGPRFRLSAELIRDSALKQSGLLVPRLGGPSVNPYTPGDLWREVSHYGSTPATAQTFVQDHGEKLYRRSLYTYWKRTAPPPNMTAFDAPNREVCTVARASTNTPLQALVTLNDTQFVEAARAFAERILGHAGNDDARLRWAFLETVSRSPSAEEAAILRGALARERRRYRANEAAALEFLGVGESPRDPRIPAAEHAAWSQVASLLLNLSETVTRN
jgi:hypothetical protein